MDTCWVNVLNLLWQWCRHFSSLRGSVSSLPHGPFTVLSSVSWGACDLGFYQLCPFVHDSWEAGTKMSERSRRKRSAGLCSCWNTAWQEVKATTPSSLSHISFPAIVLWLLPLLSSPAFSLLFLFPPFLSSPLLPFPSFTQSIDGFRVFPNLECCPRPCLHFLILFQSV